jgi:signal transduction histidine kinase
MPKPRRAWLFLPLAPLFVVGIGLAVAIAIGVLGVDYLRRVSDARAGAQAVLLADALAARIGALPSVYRLEALQLAARRSGAEFVVTTRDGEAVFDASLGGHTHVGLQQLVARGEGVTSTRLGRTRFAVRPMGERATVFLVSFVRAPEAPEAAPALLKALVALTTLLLGVAAAAAWAVARDATRDIMFVTERIQGMAHVRSEPTGEPVPIRTMDEVGALTSAFNDLVGRFEAAERAYGDDLERVRVADRERAAFLAAVSHELRTPLNAILGFADVLLSEVDGPLTPSAREEVEQIRASGQHLLELISDILEFSALESGQLKLIRSRVDVSLLAREVVREAAGALGGKPVAMRLEGDHEVLAYADGKRVRQILTNLVANAVKFTARGEIVVSVTRDGSRANLTVRDTGPGIGVAERAVIFKDFKQAGDARAKRRGTGLGLAIARRLALMHGGSIQVDSEVGQGSVFTVSLPLYFERRDDADVAADLGGLS